MNSFQLVQSGIMDQFDEQNSELDSFLNLIQELGSSRFQSKVVQQKIQDSNLHRKQLDYTNIQRLQCRVYLQRNIFVPISLQFLKIKIKSRTNSLLRWLILLSLSLTPSIQKESILGNQSLQQQRLSFLKQTQNEQMLANLIHFNNHLKNTEQMLAWRTLLFEINQKNQENILQLAKLYFLKNDHEKGIQILSKITQNSPLQAEADFYKGLTYKKLKKFKKAISLLKKALSNKNKQLSQPYRCCFQIGQTCLQLHRYAQAAYFYEYCIQNKDRIAQLKYLLALFNARLYQNVSKIISERNSFNLEKVQLYTTQQKYQMRDIIYGLYEKAIKDFQEPEVRKFYQALELYIDGSHKEFMNQFKNEVKHDQNTIQYFIVQTSKIIQSASIQVIAQKLLQIQHRLPLQKQNLELIIYLNDLIQKYKFNKNKVTIQNRQKTIPTANLISHLHGDEIQIRKLLKDNNEKIDRIKKIIELQSLIIFQQLLISARFFYETRNQDLCLSVLDRARELHLSDKQDIISVLSGQCWFSLKEYDKTKQQFKHIKNDYKRLFAMKELYTVYQRKNNQKQMQQICNQILSICKQLSLKQQGCLFKRKLGRLLMKQKRFNQAITALCESIKYYKVEESQYMSILQLYLEHNLAKEVKPLFDQLIKNQSQENKSSICSRDLLSGYFLFHNNDYEPKLWAFKKNEKNQTEQEIKPIVRAILQLPKCQQEQIKILSQTVMKYLTSLKSSLQTDKMVLFRFTAVAYRTAQILYEKKAFKDALSFYSEIAIRLHPLITKKIKQLATGQFSIPPKAKIQSFIKNNNSLISKPEAKQEDKILQLLKRYYEVQKNIFWEQFINQKIPLNLNLLFEKLIQFEDNEVLEKQINSVKNAIIPFLFFLYLENEKGMSQNIQSALIKMKTHPSSKKVVNFFIKKVKPLHKFTKKILEILDQFKALKPAKQDEFIKDILIHLKELTNKQQEC